VKAVAETVAMTWVLVAVMTITAPALLVLVRRLVVVVVVGAAEAALEGMGIVPVQ
jgi:hypothetical protein